MGTVSSNAPRHGGLADRFWARRALHRYEVERPGRERCRQGIPADPLDDGTASGAASPARLTGHRRCRLR